MLPRTTYPTWNEQIRPGDYPWLEDVNILSGWPIFRGELLGSRRAYISPFDFFRCHFSKPFLGYPKTRNMFFFGGDRECRVSWKKWSCAFGRIFFFLIVCRIWTRFEPCKFLPECIFNRGCFSFFELGISPKLKKAKAQNPPSKEIIASGTWRFKNTKIWETNLWNLFSRQRMSDVTCISWIFPLSFNPRGFWSQKNGQDCRLIHKALEGDKVDFECQVGLIRWRMTCFWEDDTGSKRLTRST